MVPLPRFSTVAGIPLTELVSMGMLTQAKLDEICTRTANGGAEITKLVGTSAWYAPGAAAAEMVEAILKDKKAILPCSVFLKGEYGVRDQFLGVPVKLGKGGAEQIIEIKLTADEQTALHEVGRRRQGTDRPSSASDSRVFATASSTDAGAGARIRPDARENRTTSRVSRRVRILPHVPRARVCAGPLNGRH